MRALYFSTAKFSRGDRLHTVLILVPKREEVRDTSRKISMIEMVKSVTGTPYTDTSLSKSLGFVTRVLMCRSDLGPKLLSRQTEGFGPERYVVV